MINLKLSVRLGFKYTQYLSNLKTENSLKLSLHTLETEIYQNSKC